MNPYWQGVLTVPALMLAAVAVALAARAATRLGAIVGGSVTRLLPESSQDRRAALGAITYSARHVWLWGCSDVGIALFSGQDVDGRGEAYERLYVRRKFTMTADFEARMAAEDADVPR